MSARVLLFLGVMITAMVVMIVMLNETQSARTSPSRTPAHGASSVTLSQPSEPQPTPPLPAISTPHGQVTPEPRTAEDPTGATNKLYRLAEVRETFHGLAKGDPVAAMQAARQLTDPTERETALLALVTEWTRGELSPPAVRARAVVGFGLEAGLGMELAHNPKLAALWAEELTEWPAGSQPHPGRGPCVRPPEVGLPL